MKNRLSAAVVGLAICSLGSCSLFSPRKTFEKKLRTDNRCYVIFWKTYDEGRITTEIRKPDSTIVIISGNNMGESLSKAERDNAVYQYSGDWKDSEKKPRPNYRNEYRKWAISEGWFKE
jgi:hypothetical protein